MKRKCIHSIIGWVFVFFGFATLSACQGDGNQNELWPVAELENYEMYVHNHNSSSFGEMRTVIDNTFKEKMISLCSRAEKFRPLIVTDVRLGGKSDGALMLQNGSYRYRVALFDVPEQLALDYIYRDSPIIVLGKDRFDEQGHPKCEWEWYCTLPPDDFAFLFEAILTYAGGEPTYPTRPTD